MRLRFRLIATMMILVAVGLVLVGLITQSSLRSELYGQTDNHLNQARTRAYAYILRSDERSIPVTEDGIDSRIDSDVYVEVLNARGQVVLSRPSGTGGPRDPAPHLPAVLPVQPPLSPAQLSGSHGTYHPDSASITVGSAAPHGPQYRLQASSLPGGTLIVATRLDSVTATLASLRHVELAVSLGVLAALFILLMFFVRRGLRPLEDMTADAGAIAAGDLTRRVQPSDNTTEIGRLGLALNGMLGQIEEAFAERTSSEDRLRSFLADASHELRTPLTAIRGYAELLRKDALADDDAREQALARIESEAERMGVLVQDLLVLARSGEGPQPSRRPVDLVAVVAETVGDTRALYPERPIHFAASDPVVVAGDLAQLRRIIQNLLQNAVAHTGPTTPVTVTVDRLGGRVLLRVRDEGPGLDPEQASRVFDRFYRGASDRADGGSGLGLFIVAVLARSMGGDVSVASEPGRGATFEVELPAWDAGAGADLGLGVSDTSWGGPLRPTEDHGTPHVPIGGTGATAGDGAGGGAGEGEGDGAGEGAGEGEGDAGPTREARAEPDAARR